MEDQKSPPPHRSSAQRTTQHLLAVGHVECDLIECFGIQIQRSKVDPCAACLYRCLDAVIRVFLGLERDDAAVQVGGEVIAMQKDQVECILLDFEGDLVGRSGEQ